MRTLKVLNYVIIASCLIFLGILFIAAYWDPRIRWLHFFEAWIYIAIIVFAWRSKPAGYLIGLSIGVFWDYSQLFVSDFIQEGREALQVLLTTGTMPRPDNFIAVPAALANLFILVCSIWAYLKVRKQQPLWKDLGWLAFWTFCTLGFLALDMAIFIPPFLFVFKNLFNPHLRI